MTIESLYKKAEQSVQSLHFLNNVVKYIDYIDSSEFLSKVVQSMQDNSLRESISVTQELNKPNSTIDYFIKSEIEDKISEQYPLYPYSQLKEACTRFKFLTQYKNDNEVPNELIKIVTNSDSGTHTSTISKRGILETVKYSYRESLKIFHTALLNQIELAKSKGGVFSKYFDYDDKKGILYFQGSEIEINERKKLTNAHFLLKYLFSNSPFEQHFYDQLDNDNALDHKSIKSYYDACVDIQNKVNEATGIDDFLEFSSGKGLFVRINPDYSI